MTAKEEKIRMEGEITESLRNGMHRILLENAHEMIGYAAGKMRRFRIRIVRRSERRAAERRHPLRRRFYEDRIARDQPAAGSPSSALQPSHRVAMCQRPPAVEG